MRKPLDGDDICKYCDDDIRWNIRLIFLSSCSNLYFLLCVTFSIVDNVFV